MKSLNTFELIGYLGKAPMLETLNGGHKVCRISVATTHSKKGQNNQYVDETDWNYLTVWGKDAEYLAQYAGKGTRCYLTGRIATRQYKDRDGNDRFTTELNVRGLMILAQPRQQEPTPQYQQQTPQPQQTPPQHQPKNQPQYFNHDIPLEDDIPC